MKAMSIAHMISWIQPVSTEIRDKLNIRLSVGVHVQYVACGSGKTNSFGVVIVGEFLCTRLVDAGYGLR